MSQIKVTKWSMFHNPRKFGPLSKLNIFVARSTNSLQCKWDHQHTLKHFKRSFIFDNIIDKEGALGICIRNWTVTMQARMLRRSQNAISEPLDPGP